VAKLKAAEAGMPVKELLLLAEGAQKSIEGHQERRSAHFVIRFPRRMRSLLTTPWMRWNAAWLCRPTGFVPTADSSDILRSPAIWLWSRRSASTRWSALAPLRIQMGRIMLSTPVHAAGLCWLDSLSHELVHYAVASVTHDRTPVWLQEGLAKFLNTAGAIRPAWRSRRRCNTCWPRGWPPTS